MAEYGSLMHIGLLSSKKMDIDTPQVLEASWEWSGIRRLIHSTHCNMARDNMHRMWPDLYSPWEAAMLPSEELLKVTEGSDAGWPYYYYDQMQGKKLLKP